MIKTCPRFSSPRSVTLATGSSVWIQHIYLDEPFKHVSQRQEGNEAVILIGENNFLQDRDVMRWHSEGGPAVMQQQCGGRPHRSRLSLWEILRSRQPRFHAWAWLPLGFLCEDRQTKLRSAQQPNVGKKKILMGYYWFLKRFEGSPFSYLLNLFFFKFLTPKEEC